MISRISAIEDPLATDRLIVVGDRFAGRPLVHDLRRRYADLRLVECNTYMSAIVEASRESARAIIACVDPELHQLENAIAGLRAAAGAATKLVLCCTPESEPLTRQVMAAGADDYVLFPVDDAELDAAIGYARPARAPQHGLTAAPAATPEELDLLAETLSSLTGKPMRLIENIAKLTRTALSARGVTVIVEGAVATSGDVVTRPVLTASLTGEHGVIGQLAVAERAQGPFTPHDVDKLSHYATIAGHLLAAASKQRQWAHLALTDECSGLPNRRYLNTQLDEIIPRAADERFPVALLLFDVDDFKSYNDQFGHDAGDEIIRVIGELFQRNCRAQDIVARYGGDEFAVVFWDSRGPRAPGSEHLQNALNILERFKEDLRTYKFQTISSADRAQLTVSGGLAAYPWDASTRADLLKRADEALLAAKRAGKNRVLPIGRHAG